MKNELLEKWIVVRFHNDEDEPVKVTARSNFESMSLCLAYGKYGQEYGCYDAGCYSLQNSQSSFLSDLLEAIDEHFKTSYVDNLENSSYNDIEELFEAGEFTEEEKEFIQLWINENENHTEIKGWTYWDSHNFKTVVLEADSGETDCVEINEEEQIKILSQMPQETPWFEGTNKSVKSDDYVFHFDRWATNPWYCIVEEK